MCLTGSVRASVHVGPRRSDPSALPVSVWWQVSRMQLRWLLTSCLWVLDVTLVCSATFKIALIGPWSCDPMFSRAMPTAAANLALSRIQSDSSLSRGYHYSVKLLEEDCSLSKGPEPSRLTVVQAEAPPGPQVCCSASFQLWRLWGTWRATATSTSAPSTRRSDRKSVV